MAVIRQTHQTIQKLTQEQRQLISARQVLAAKLTELSVEELQARIDMECENNPWLEKSASPTDDGSAEAYSESGEDASVEGKESEEFYAPDPTAEGAELDDAFPQPQNEEGSGAYRTQNQQEQQSFHDVLISQMHEYDLSEHRQYILEYLIGSLEADGLLHLPLERIVDELDIYWGVSTDVGEVAEVLAILQQFDPSGVGARNLVECLLIQVKRNPTLPMRRQLLTLLTDYNADLRAGRWEAIQRGMKLSHAELEAMRRSLHRLNPRPGGSLGESALSDNARLVPDFTVFLDEEGRPHFHLNEDHVPVVTLADDYTAESGLALADADSSAIRKKKLDGQRYLRSMMDEGRMFIEALAQRRHSMVVTMAAILRLQVDYFREGDENLLRPMKLQDVADLAKIDISTVSRVCRSKSVDTPYGVFPLNWFFSSKVKTGDGEELSVRKMQNALRSLVDGEDKRHPYSDERLAALLRQQGYLLERRTVAKHRAALGILDSRLRR